MGRDLGLIPEDVRSEEAREVGPLISGVVLAAGTSSRFARTKQLVAVGGKPLVRHAVDALADAGLDEIVVVLGHDADAIEEGLGVLPALTRTVRNPRYRDGQASSLAAGIHELDLASEGAVVLMADQPGVEPAHVRALVNAFRAGRARITRLRYRDGPGPALLSREIYGEAGHLRGDIGARALMASHPEWVEDVPVASDAPPDVDTPEDLDRL
jgi:CTP:molybdopterin cytidylyltransferase MocA